MPVTNTEVNVAPKESKLPGRTRRYNAGIANPIFDRRVVVVAQGLQDPQKTNFFGRERTEMFEDLGEVYKVAREDRNSKGKGWDSSSLEQKAAFYSPVVQAIYRFRGNEGLREFGQLTHEQIVEDGENFARTVARELICHEELELFAQEREFQQEVESDINGKKINRGKLIKKIFRGLKLRTKRARETTRVNDRLRMSSDEKRGIRRIKREEYINGPSSEKATAEILPVGELSPQQRIYLAQRRALANVLGESAGIDVNDPTPVSDPYHKGKVDTMEKYVNFDRVATADRDLSKKRKELIEATRTGDTDKVTKAINSLRMEEIRHNAATVALNVEEARQRRDITIEQMHEKYKDRVHAGVGRGRVRLALGTLAQAAAGGGGTVKRRAGSVLGSVGERSANRVQQFGNRFVRIGRHAADKVLWGRVGKIGDSIRNSNRTVNENIQIMRALREPQFSRGEGIRGAIALQEQKHGMITALASELQIAEANQRAAAAGAAPTSTEPAAGPERVVREPLRDAGTVGGGSDRGGGGAGDRRPPGGSSSAGGGAERSDGVDARRPEVRTHERLPITQEDFDFYKRYYADPMVRKFQERMERAQSDGREEDFVLLQAEYVLTRRDRDLMVRSVTTDDRDTRDPNTTRGLNVWVKGPDGKERELRVWKLSPNQERARRLVSERAAGDEVRQIHRETVAEMLGAYFDARGGRPDDEEWEDVVDRVADRVSEIGLDGMARYLAEHPLGEVLASARAGRRVSDGGGGAGVYNPGGGDGGVNRNEREPGAGGSNGGGRENPLGDEFAATATAERSRNRLEIDPGLQNLNRDFMTQQIAELREQLNQPGLPDDVKAVLQFKLEASQLAQQIVARATTGHELDVPKIAIDMFVRGNDVRLPIFDALRKDMKVDMRDLLQPFHEDAYPPGLRQQLGEYVGKFLEGKNWHFANAAERQRVVEHVVNSYMGDLVFLDQGQLRRNPEQWGQFLSRVAQERRTREEAGKPRIEAIKLDENVEREAGKEIIRNYVDFLTEMRRIKAGHGLHGFSMMGLDSAIDHAERTYGQIRAKVNTGLPLEQAFVAVYNESGVETGLAVSPIMLGLVETRMRKLLSGAKDWPQAMHDARITGLIPPLDPVVITELNNLTTSRLKWEDIVEDHTAMGALRTAGLTDDQITVLSEIMVGRSDWENVMRDPDKLARLSDAQKTELARLSRFRNIIREAAVPLASLPDSDRRRIRAVERQRILDSAPIFGYTVEGKPVPDQAVINAETARVDAEMGSFNYLDPRLVVEIVARQARAPQERTVLLNQTLDAEISGFTGGERVEATEIWPKNDYERAVLTEIEQENNAKLDRLIGYGIDLSTASGWTRIVTELESSRNAARTSGNYLETAFTIHPDLLKFLDARLGTLRTAGGVVGLRGLHQIAQDMAPNSGRTFVEVRNAFATMVRPENREQLIDIIRQNMGLDEFGAERIITILENTALSVNVTGAQLSGVLEEGSLIYAPERIFNSLLDLSPNTRDSINETVLEYVIDSLQHGINDAHTREVVAQIFRSNGRAYQNLAELMLATNAADARSYIASTSENNTAETARLINLLHQENNGEEVNRAVAQFAQGHAAEARPIIAEIFSGSPAQRDRFVSRLVAINPAGAVTLAADLATHNPEAARSIVQTLITKEPAVAATTVDTLVHTHPALAAQFAAEIVRHDPTFVHDLINANGAATKQAIEAVARGVLGRRLTAPDAHSHAELFEFVREHLIQHPDRATEFIRQYATLTGGLTAPLETKTRIHINALGERRQQFLMTGAQGDVAVGTDMLNALANPADRRAAITGALGADANTTTDFLSVAVGMNLLEAMNAIADGTQAPERRRAFLQAAATAMRGDRALLDQMANALTADGQRQILGNIARENPTRAAELLVEFASRNPAAKNLGRNLLRGVAPNAIDTRNIVASLTAAALDPEHPERQAQIWKEMLQRLVAKDPALMAKYLGQTVVRDLIDSKEAEVAQLEGDLRVASEMTSEILDPKTAEKVRAEVEKQVKKIGPLAGLEEVSIEEIVRKAKETVMGRATKGTRVDANKIRSRMQRELDLRARQREPEVVSLIDRELSHHKNYNDLLRQASPEDRTIRVRSRLFERFAGRVQAGQTEVVLDVPGTGRKATVGMIVFVRHDAASNQVTDSHLEGAGRLPAGDRLVKMTRTYAELTNDQRAAVLANTTEIMFQDLNEHRPENWLRWRAMRDEEKRQYARDEAEALLRRSRFIDTERAYRVQQRAA